MPSAAHVTVKNTSGKTASDLHLTFRGTGGSLQVNPDSIRPRDGRRAPAVPSNEGSSTNEAVIEWSQPVVGDGESVSFDAATMFGPLEFESGYWTGPGEDGPRSKIGTIKRSDVTVSSKADRGDEPPPAPHRGRVRERATALDDTSESQTFLTDATQAAIERARDGGAEEILARAGDWLPALSVARTPIDLLRVPWLPAGTEVDQFVALGALFYSPMFGADCSKELAALLKAADELRKAQEALAAAEDELHKAEQELTQANAELTEAEKHLKAAQENTNHQTGHLIIPDPWTLPFSPLALMYEAAFAEKVRRARRKASDLATQVKLLQELVKIRRRALEAATRAYLDALLAWLRCAAGE